MIKENIGKRIRQYRKKYGITQQAMAEIIDVSVTSVCNMENGKTLPTLEHFIMIANALGITSDVLLVDILDATYLLQATQLSELLEKIPLHRRRRILALLETIIDGELSALMPDSK